jgi:hypothetical protein
MKTIVNYATSLQKKGRSVVDSYVPNPDPDVFGPPGSGAVIISDPSIS